MATHDAAMTRFSQWWRRAVRAGHAYAEGMALHAHEPERYNVKPLLSAAFWGLVAPLVVAVSLASGFWWRPAFLFGIAAVGGYLLLMSRSCFWRLRLKDPPASAALYSLMIVPAKVAHVIGAIRYILNRLLGRSSRLIEYKGAHTIVPLRSIPDSSTK